MINGRLAGPKKFEKKNKLLRSIGIEVGEGTKIVGPLYVSASLSIGKNCWIGRNFEAQGNGTVVIEDNCDIAPDVIINTGGHMVGQEKRRAGDGLTADVVIGSGTWVGLRTTILAGCILGKGDVIAAGSVVTKSTEENSLYAGVPAQFKKKYL